MTKTLRIDDRDYADMQRGIGLLVRYFEIGDPQPANEVPPEATEAKGYALAHSRQEFANADKLKEWASKAFTSKEPGKYRVRKTKFYKRFDIGDNLFLHKDRLIVGYATVVEPVIGKQEKNDGFTYEGSMKLGDFHPLDITLEEASAATGQQISPRPPVQLLRNYRRILALKAELV